MSQPKEPPVSIRPGEGRLARIDGYAKAHALSRNLAIMVLIDAALAEAEKPAEPPPKPSAAIPAPKVGGAVPAPVQAPRSRFTMDDVRPKFVPRLKNR